jgi:hypothetical protein
MIIAIGLAVSDRQTRTNQGQRQDKHKYKNQW